MLAIRSSHDQGMALFGTCAGLILLADDLADADALQDFDRIGGLKVKVRRNAYGTQLNSFEDQLKLTGLESPLPAVFIRAPVIEDVCGDEVEVLAHTRGLPAVVRQGSILAASFHPELTEDNRLHQMFLSMAAP